MMALTVLCYPKCTTCQKALRWLDEHHITYQVRNIKEQNPSEEELKRWHERSGLALKRFFNTSGLVYKSMQLSQKLASIPEEEQYKLLASDGMLVKRPLVVGDSVVLAGFKEAEWNQLLTNN